MASCYYCPACWHQIHEEGTCCLMCGYDLSDDAALPYEEKLFHALKHPIRENRMMAIQILGERRSYGAVSRLAAILETESDVYVIREIMHALSQIGNESSRDLIEQLKTHPSKLVREKAAQTASVLSRQDGSSLRGKKS